MSTTALGVQMELFNQIIALTGILKGVKGGSTCAETERIYL